MAWGASAPAATVNTNVAATSFATASWTPTANRLLVAFVGFSIAAGTAVAPTLSGNGLTWTFVRQGIGANPDGMAIYVALSTASPSTGALTIDFAGVNQTYCIAQVIEVDGADLSGTALAAIIQNDGTSPAAQASPFSRSFASVPQVSSRVMAGYYLTLNTAMTPRANWTELFDAGNAVAPARELEVQWRSDVSEQTYSVSGWAGSVQFRAGAIEIKAVAAPVTTQSRRVKQLRPPPRTKTIAVLASDSPPIQRPTSAPTSLHHFSYLRRTRITSLVPPPASAPVNPSIVFSPTQHRQVRGWLRRTRFTRPPDTSPIPPTTDCSLLLADGVSYLLLADGSSHLSLVCGSYPPQFQRHRVLYPPRRHRPPITTVFPSTPPPVNPSIVFNPSQRRIIRAFLRKPKRVDPPNTQTAVPNPTIIFSPSQRRVIRPYLRRSKTPVPVRDQVNPPFPIFPVTQRRVQRNFPRRGKVISPVPPQVIIPPPAIVFRSARHPVLALRGILARRGKVTRQFLTQNVPPDLAPAIVILDLQTSGVVSMTITTSANVTLTLAVSATVSMTLSSLNYKDS